jgi:hypothetical protein
MFPILARAFFVLRGRQPAEQGADVMSATTAKRRRGGIYHKAAACAPSGAGRCGLAYSADLRRDHLPAPPIYMFITSLKTSAEISAARQPVVGAQPDARELHGAADQPDVPHGFFRTA